MMSCLGNGSELAIIYRPLACKAADSIAGTAATSSSNLPTPFGPSNHNVSSVNPGEVAFKFARPNRAAPVESGSSRCSGRLRSGSNTRPPSSSPNLGAQLRAARSAILAPSTAMLREAEGRVFRWRTAPHPHRGDAYLVRNTLKDNPRYAAHSALKLATSQVRMLPETRVRESEPIAKIGREMRPPNCLPS